MTLTTEDKFALAELVGRYGDYADERDWDKIKTVFAEEASFDFKGMAKLESLDEIRGFLMRDNPNALLGHFFTNIYSDVSDSGANVSFRSLYVMPGGNMKSGFTTFYGTYKASAIKTDNGWRFNHIDFYPANGYQKSLS